MTQTKIKGLKMDKAKIMKDLFGGLKTSAEPFKLEGNTVSKEKFRELAGEVKEILKDEECERSSSLFSV